MGATMQVQGSCHCGQIAYEAAIDPKTVSLCNCTDCQMLTGSAFRVSVPTRKADFRLSKGRLTTYIKTAASGLKRIHAFCPNCGTPVYASANVDDPPTLSLRVGCLAERAQLAPQKRIWCRSALAWAQNVSGVPGIDHQ